MDIKLFVVSHKKLDNNSALLKEREIIYVGKNSTKFKTENDYVDCDKKDNIADKNPVFCELTALYYIWKNVKCDCVGIEHYRRFFRNGKRIPIKKSKIEKYLKQHDLIAVNVFPFFPISIKRHFIHNHGKEYYEILRESVSRNYPDYLKYFDKKMNGFKISFFNMLIAPKEIFDKYCEFIFTILFDIEKTMKIPEDPYQRRMIGFMAERLLSAFIAGSHYKAKLVRHFRVWNTQKNIEK